MTDLVMKIILLIVIITVLVFIILKELKKRRAEIIEKNKNSFSKKEKKIIKKEIESSENKKSLKIVQEKPSELSKLLFNLSSKYSLNDKIGKWYIPYLLVKLGFVSFIALEPENKTFISKKSYILFNSCSKLLASWTSSIKIHFPP